MQIPFLQPGDTIGICATARWVTEDQLQPALDTIHHWGFKAKVMPQVFYQNGQLAGTDKQRTQGLLDCLLDPEIKAVIIARGGYGSVRVVDQIPDVVLKNNPKWLCGYSDITVLHNRWNNLGIPTIHSTMPISFPDATPLALEQLKNALSGKWQSRTWRAEGNINAPIEAPIVGGNLSVIYSQLGSATQLEAKGKILFLEDVDEMIYHLDRMLMGLKRAGVLDGIKGLLLGGFTQMKDNTQQFGFGVDNPWGPSVQEIFWQLSKDLDVPIAFDFPAGHWEKNEAFFLGKCVKLKTKVDNSLTLSMDFPSS